MTQEEMAVKLAEVDARSKSNTHRIDKLEESNEALNKLATAVEVMATKQDTMAETLDRLDAKVETIEQKPAKRWEGVVEKIIYGIVGSLVTALGAGLLYLLAAGPWDKEDTVMTEKELRAKIVSIAQSYIGRKESDGSHREIIDIYNGHKPLARGYPVKYTDAWCSTFASAVAIKAGLTGIIPTECGCGKPANKCQALNNTLSGKFL